MNTNKYIQAILKLIPLAQESTGGSRVAAQVLLSAYNGDVFQLNIIDLCNLDEDNYQAALTVIQCRRELNTEPHRLIENGDIIFRKLWAQWLKYHVDHRWKPYCKLCDGSGLMWEDQNDEDNDNQITCIECNGVGFLK